MARRKKAKGPFDFESVYKTYPNKEGKLRGMRALKLMIKTAADYQRFAAAVENYCAVCRRDGRPRKYIKHWSTFVTSWEDYATPLPSEPPPAVDQIQRIVEGKL